jgi:hypothetical protein
LKGSAGLQQGGCFHFVLLYLVGAGLILTSILNFGLGGVGLILTSILNFGLGGVGRGGCFGVGELLGAANHLIALLQLLVDGN